MGRISSAERARVRARLLQTGAEHFAAYGYDGANINRISLEAGFAKGTVYGYFESKAALFGAVLQLGSEATVNLFRRMDIEADTPAQLRGLVRADVALVRRHEAFAKTLIQEYVLNRSETRALVDGGLAPILTEVTRLLRRGKQSGEIASRVSTKQLARLFCMQLNMLYIERWRTGTPSWASLPDLSVDLFLRGVGSRAAPRADKPE